jgi:hypothetical protein
MLFTSGRRLVKSSPGSCAPLNGKGLHPSILTQFLNSGVNNAPNFTSFGHGDNRFGNQSTRALDMEIWRRLLDISRENIQ